MTDTCSHYRCERTDVGVEYRGRILNQEVISLKCPDHNGRQPQVEPPEPYCDHCGQRHYPGRCRWWEDE